MMKSAPLATVMSGETQRNSAGESCYCQLRCHDPAGDDYVTFTRKTIRLSFSEDDVTRDAIEEWADDVPAFG